MPKPYSEDLRAKILEAWDRREVMQEELATRFGVSLSFLAKIIRQREQTGVIAPKPHGGGLGPKLTPEQMELLAEAIDATPDATQQELADGLAALGAPLLHRATIGRAVARLKLTRKKSQNTPPSERRRG